MSSPRLEYRSIGSEGDPWPQWIRDLRHASGVYVIKQHGHNGEVVYVGSSEKRLYDTITRHFQQWKRKKQWWKGLRGEGHDPGLTYPRGRFCVAIIATTPGQAKVKEADTITRLRPRDNLVARPDGRVADGDEIPF
jgi:excinuclease UvrABC nuclease subunit